MQKESNVKYTGVWFSNWIAINKKLPNGERKYRYIINEGSSRSSKTISLMDCYDKYARENQVKRLTVWRDTKTDCKKTVLNDLLKHHKRTARYKLDYVFNKTESILTYNTDSTFEIHGTDDEETVHGLEQDAAWLNEPYKISRDTFDQIDQRTSDFIFIDWNPKKAHWIEDLKKDPRSIVIHSTFKDNPFCPPEQKIKILGYQTVNKTEAYRVLKNEAYQYDTAANLLNLEPGAVRELERCKLNELKKSGNEFKWDVYGLGMKAENPNRILNFKEIPDIEYLKLVAPEYYGTDWGAVDPMGVISVKYYDGALYVHQINYKSENNIRESLTETERKQIENHQEGLIVWLFNKWGVDKSRPNICDNNRISKIVALRNSGYDYAVECRKWKGSIIDGIDLLNGLTVYFTSSSTDLKYEQENYQRKVDRYGIVMDEPEDKDNHLIDPLRYVAQFLQSEGVIRIAA
jgi:PBSX family phage terminase large subunit